MWQVYLYLANERQVRERREARQQRLSRRWLPGRGGRGRPNRQPQRTPPPMV
jgi:hypothetical protein